MNQHCTEAVPEFSAANTRALQARQTRNAELFGQARAELKRAERLPRVAVDTEGPGARDHR
jgi:hypothetical protein